MAKQRVNTGNFAVNVTPFLLIIITAAPRYGDRAEKEMNFFEVIFVTVSWLLVAEPQHRLSGTCFWANYDSHKYSWPSSPPHWLSQKRNRAQVKPLSLSYFINFAGMYRPGGLMVIALAWVKGFSWFLVSRVFDSWCMYIFWWALTLLFYQFLVTFISYWYFIFPYVLLRFLLDIKSSGLIKIALVSH